MTKFRKNVKAAELEDVYYALYAANELLGCVATSAGESVIPPQTTEAMTHLLYSVNCEALEKLKTALFEKGAAESDGTA